jgi:hypothetical protein
MLTAACICAWIALPLMVRVAFLLVAVRQLGMTAQTMSQATRGRILLSVLVPCVFFTASIVLFIWGSLR